MDFSKWGIHELQNVPDLWLKALKPQVMVHAGAYTNEPEVNMQKHRVRVQHLLDLLPGTLLAVRWWKDDDILLRLADEYFAGRTRAAFWWRDPAVARAIAQMFWDRFARLHVPGSVMMIGNEDAQSDTDPLVFECTATLHTAVCIMATELQIECALCCTPMGTPQYGHHVSLVPLFRAMQDGRAVGVVHWWRFNTYFPVPLNAQDVIDFSTRNEREGRKVAAEAGCEFPPTFIGEIGTVDSLSNTGVGQIGAGVRVDAFADALENCGIEVPSVIYGWGDGINGGGWETFNVARDPEFVAALPQLAPRTPLTAIEEWKARNTPVAQTVNMREFACPETSPVRMLTTGEVTQTYWRDNIGYQGKNGQWEQFCIKSFGGVRWLCRLMDISDYLTPGKNTVYALFEDEAMTKPGGKWCPEICTVGAVYARDVWVQEYKLDGTKIPKGTPGTKTGRMVTYFKVVKVHPTWTTPEGTQLQNVAECVYSTDYNAVVAANEQRTTGILERYFYCDGLVAFIDYHPNGIKTYLTKPPYPAALPAQIAISWWKPTVGESMKPPSTPGTITVPPAASLGELITGRITVSGSANVRDYPSLNGKVIGGVRTGDTVRYRPQTFTGGLYNGTSNRWYMLEGGYLAADVVTLTPVTPPPQPAPTKVLLKLSVPYFSQTDAQAANKYRNDCGTACSLSMTGFEYVVRRGLLAPDLISVNDMSDDTDLKRSDDGLGVSELVDLLKGYGVRAEKRVGMTAPQLEAAIRGNSPVIVLVTTKPLGAAYSSINEDICHFIILTGLIGTDDGKLTGFLFHDPYRMGRDQQISIENLIAAMQTAKCSAGGVQQGVVLL